jgi:hypothetical protein
VFLPQTTKRPTKQQGQSEIGTAGFQATRGTIGCCVAQCASTVPMNCGM